MLTKRLIACFDIINDRVTKNVKFQGEPVDIAAADTLAATMYASQIDELMLCDINAGNEKRGINLNIIKKVAAHVFIPFGVGGGISGISSMFDALKSGAEKISLDSLAVRNPEIISEGAKAFGAQCIVLHIRAKKNDLMPSGYEVYTDGAKTPTNLDVITWAIKGESLGAGEICVTSIDREGTFQGYDICLMKKIESAVRTPLIACGGAGKPEHLLELFTKTQVQAAIISSMLYSPLLKENYTVKSLKQFLSENGVPMRL
ncbi:MAG: imidazole glycerol phosphate synthase cyclase subunit [Defluviitaleaceae bacterium]|nr:imidazole glycerol phosphate synthase cyclase subunit [Defluviitaleaceae bacterium]